MAQAWMYKVQMVLGKKELIAITYWMYAWGHKSFWLNMEKFLEITGIVTIKFGKTCQVHDCIIL